MAIFEIQGPDGGHYQIDAPDMNTAVGVIHGMSSAPVGPMGSDGVSGDELRARNAGNTRAQMSLPDISAGYDMAAGKPDEQKAMAEAYVRREQQDSPISTGIGNRVRQIAKGVPVLGGALDEMNAGTSALLGNSYGKALDYERARDRVFEQDHPKESTGLQIGGGVAGTVASMGALGPLASGGSPATTILRSALTGAGVGGADGFLRADGDMKDRALGAGQGAVIGGVLGGAAPVVASGISAGARKIADAVSTNRDLGQLGLTRPAADVVNRVLSADGALGPQGQANMARAGQGAMLADAGPSATGLLDMVIQRGGPGASTATQAINQRAADASRVVTGALDSSLGSPTGIQTAENAIRTGSKAARGAAYDAAYATPIDYSHPTGMAIEDALKRVPGDVINNANRLMKINGEKSAQILANIADDGSVTYHSMPDVRQLDYITRALNHAAKSGEGQGALGGQTPLGAAYQNLARDIRGMMRESVPAYGQALDTAAEPIARREALQFGSKLLSPSVTRDEVAQTVKGMSQAEIASAKQGIRAQIDDAIANVSKVMSDPNLDARQATKALRDLSSASARQKVASIIGEQEAAGLFRNLDQAATAFELRAATSQNSKTFARQAMKEASDDMAKPGPIGLLMEGSPVKAAKSALQGLLASGPDAKVAAQDAMYNNVASALTGKRGQDAQDFAKKLADAYRRKGMFDKGANALGLLSAGAVSGGAFQATPRPASR